MSRPKEGVCGGVCGSAGGAERGGKELEKVKDEERRRKLEKNGVGRNCKVRNVI